MARHSFGGMAVSRLASLLGVFHAQMGVCERGGARSQQQPVLQPAAGVGRTGRWQRAPHTGARKGYIDLQAQRPIHGSQREWSASGAPPRDGQGGEGGGLKERR